MSSSEVSTGNVTPKRRVRQRRSADTLTNAFEVWASLREAGTAATFDGCPAVARRDDVMEVLSDPETFVSAGRLDLGSSRRLIPQEIDPPDHRRFRRLLEPVVSPKAVRKMEPAIRALAVKLIEDVQDAGSCDFVKTVAMLAPRFFAFELLDLPESGFEEMIYLKDEILHPAGDTDEERQASKKAAGVRIEELLAAAMHERMERPTDDILSRVIEMELDGDRLSPDEIQAIYYQLFVAGLDSVAAMTTCFFAFLAGSPEHQQQIASDPSVIPNAVEEMLRHQSAVEDIARVAARDCEVNGQSLRAGDQVVIVLGAANHDPSVFPDPDTVDFDRNANKHLAFSAGIHRCLGLHLARLELAIVLEEWHKRIPSYRLAEGTQLKWLDSPIRTVESLPLEWA
jgi:cytochrome P450